MPTRREALIVGAVGIAAAAAGVLVGPLALQSQSGAARLLSAGYPDLSGKQVRIGEWPGVLVCNFWATWCEPCRAEVPLLLKLRRAYSGKGLEVVGIGIDNAAKMRQFAKDYGVDYPLLVADASAVDLMRDLGNPSGALPFTAVKDARGTIAYRHLGLLKEPDITQVIEGILR